MTEDQVDRRGRPGVIRQAYVVVCALLLAAVVVQFYLAAFGVFTAPAREHESQFVLHLVNGRMVLPALMILAVAGAALARAPGRLIGFTALPIALIAGQTILFLLAALTGSSPERTNVGGQIVLGFHALNGLAILWTSIVLLRRARAFARAGRAAAVADRESDLAGQR
ncbi:DUF6220 domain-containing protein [Asanoa iriomotensis]|uniref:Uncharacterized protein n=1 Tax=Asanoa iriomotensis TaxID=234613 RepID=A0ABQ4C3R0_9ACTN|nr:DUF6220 domain-containing protein [Asanoa iriomotensis]GIF57409.1 hypothetical protein Air01nite_35040 [Asanoa iriomotensis]